jgi:MFS family permease
MKLRRILNRTNQLDAAAFLVEVGVGAVIFGVGRRAAELGATAMELGILNAAMPVAYSMLALLTGGISDRWGRRRVTVAAAAVASLAALLNIFTTRVAVLVLINVLLGLAVGLFWPALVAWVGEGRQGRALSKRLARFSVGWNSGLLAGFALTGFVFENGGPQTAFLLAAISIAVVVGLLCPPLPDDSAPMSLDETELSPPVPAGRGFRKTAWLSNFGMTVTFFGIVAVFPQLATRLGIEAGAHGVLLAIWRAGALLMFWLLPHFHWWQMRLWPVWIAQGVAVIVAVCFGFASEAWVFGTALFIGGLMIGFNYQCSIFFTLSEMTQKGKGSGIHEATLGAGMFVGPILAGAVGNEFSTRAPYFFCAGFLACWIALQMAIVAWRRRFATIPAARGSA